MLEEVGYLFYLVNPWKHTYSSAEDVPAYITQAIPYFVAIFVLEQLIRLWGGLGIFQVNDAITSAAQGILMEQSKLLFPTFNIFFYSWIYDNYRLVDLSFDSVYSWILSLVLIDFGFYWFHRACHGELLRRFMIDCHC
jgi:alkylglycerol monooxygenase